MEELDEIVLSERVFTWLWMTNYWGIPGMLAVVAIALQCGALYYYVWKLGRILGIKAKLKPFIYSAAALIGMMVPRVLMLMQFRNPVIVNVVNSLVYLFDSLMLLLAGSGMCVILQDTIQFYQRQEINFKHWLNRLVSDANNARDYWLMAESLKEAIIMIDSSSTIIYANKTMCDLFRYRKEEIAGKSLTMLMPERYRSKHLAALAAYTQSNKRTMPWDNLKLQGLRSDGREFSISVSFSEFTSSGEQRFVGIIR